jgi:predicted transcriptional regulator
MSNRELVIDVVSKLPEDTPIEDILEKIAFVAGVNEAIAQADRGEVISLDELEKRMKQWATEST